MKKLIGVIIVILLVAGGIYWLSQRPVAAPTIPSTPPPVTSQTYTLAEVAKHHDAQSCWVAISGKVYDITNAIAQHPGGPAILRGCGQEDTASFNGETGGHQHSSTAHDILTNYYLGPLATSSNS